MLLVFDYYLGGMSIVFVNKFKIFMLDFLGKFGRWLGNIDVVMVGWVGCDDVCLMLVVGR